MQRRVHAGASRSHPVPAGRSRARAAVRQPAPPSGVVDQILTLQRQAGNRATAASLMAVQRALAIGGQRVTEANAQDVWQEVASHLPKWPLPYMNRARELFEEWVGASGPWAPLGVRLMSGVDRKYPDAKQVALAIGGEIQSAENLAEETELAKRLYSDPTIIKHLSTLMPKIRDYINTEYSDTRAKMWQKAQASWRGAWIRWGPSRFVGVEKALASPYRDIGTNFATIRMASLALHDGPSLEMHVNVRNGGDRGFERTKVKNVRHTTMALDESHPWVVDARYFGIPVTAGPSGTLNHMFWAADKAGASYNEILALAWAGVIFFNQDYVTMANDPHRLHEIMDIAAGYGIKYDATDYKKFLATGPAWQ